MITPKQGKHTYTHINLKSLTKLLADSATFSVKGTKPVNNFGLPWLLTMATVQNDILSWLYFVTMI